MSFAYRGAPRSLKLTLLWALWVAGCASPPTAPELTTIDLPQDKLSNLRHQIQLQSEQMENLETKVESLDAAIQPKRGNKQKLTAMELYRSLQTHLKSKNLYQCLDEVRRFLKLYPDHVYRDRVAYARVEALFGQARFPNVLVRARDLEAEYPFSLMRSKARYTAGLSLIHMGRTDEAVAHFKSLLIDFPDSPESRWAAKELDKIGSLAVPGAS